MQEVQCTSHQSRSMGFERVHSAGTGSRHGCELFAWSPGSCAPPLSAAAFCAGLLQTCSCGQQGPGGGGRTCTDTAEAGQRRRMESAQGILHQLVPTQQKLNREAEWKVPKESCIICVPRPDCMIP
eukprot:1157727-Pelagomonas_calceolata.AAC.3